MKRILTSGRVVFLASLSALVGLALASGCQMGAGGSSGSNSTAAPGDEGNTNLNGDEDGSGGADNGTDTGGANGNSDETDDDINADGNTNSDDNTNSNESMDGNENTNVGEEEVDLSAICTVLGDAAECEDDPRLTDDECIDAFQALCSELSMGCDEIIQECESGLDCAAAVGSELADQCERLYAVFCEEAAEFCGIVADGQSPTDAECLDVALAGFEFDRFIACIEPVPVVSSTSQGVALQSQCGQAIIECTSSWPTPLIVVQARNGQIVTSTATGFIVQGSDANARELVQFIGGNTTLGAGATEVSYRWSSGAVDVDPCTLAPGEELSTDADPQLLLAEGFHYIRLTVENDIVEASLVLDGCGTTLEDVPNSDFLEIEVEVRDQGLDTGET